MRRRTAVVAAAGLLATALTGALAYAQSAASAAPGRQPPPTPVAAAKAHVGGPGQEFHVVNVVADRSGVKHTRMLRTYKKLPVLGGDVIVHQKADGAWAGSDQTLTTAPTGDVTAKVSGSAAERKALARGHRIATRASRVIEARTGAPRLAWLVVSVGTQKDGTPSHLYTTVDAATGKVLLREERVHTADGDGKSLYSGTVPLATTPVSGGYELKDPTRGNGYTGDAKNKTDFCLLILCLSRAPATKMIDADNHWGNGTNSDRATAAVDAQYGTNVTWDYYKSIHGRNGIFNDGKGSYNRVHYGTNYVNAFWDPSCKCMTYGDGDNKVAGPLVSLDVAGHEMSHGVTTATANLTYSGESGGLNEATSDIFGSMVEFYSNNGSDKGDYLIGEEIMLDRPALRYMDKPSRDGKSADCWSSTVKDLDVHYSSGVGNHFFYLLAEGSGPKTINGVAHDSPTCNGSTVTGIGREAAQRIWYQALTAHMTSSTNYKGARDATLKAVTDLYGAGHPYAARVSAAWAAVNVTA